MTPEELDQLFPEFPKPARRRRLRLLPRVGVAIAIVGAVIAIAAMVGAWPNPGTVPQGGACSGGTTYSAPQFLAIDQETGASGSPATVDNISFTPNVAFTVAYPNSGTSIPNTGSDFAIIKPTLPDGFVGTVTLNTYRMVWSGPSGNDFRWATDVPLSIDAKPCVEPTTTIPATTTTVAPTTTIPVTTTVPATTTTVAPTTTVPATTTTVAPTTTIPVTTTTEVSTSTTSTTSTTPTTSSTTTSTVMPTTTVPSTSTTRPSTVTSSSAPPSTSPPSSTSSTTTTVVPLTTLGTPPPPTTKVAAPPSGSLPVTGTDSGTLLWLGVCLLLMGCFVLWIGRRRPRS